MDTEHEITGNTWEFPDSKSIELLEKLKQEARICGEERIAFVDRNGRNPIQIHVTWDSDIDITAAEIKLAAIKSNGCSRVGPCRSVASVFGF